MSSHAHGDVSFGVILGIISLFIGFAIQIAFAIGAYVDGHNMMEQKRGPFLVSPLIWALAILVGGVPIVVAYWAVHHSTLRPRPTPDAASSN